MLYFSFRESSRQKHKCPFSFCNSNVWVITQQCMVAHVDVLLTKYNAPHTPIWYSNITVMITSFRTDRSGQTVPTQIRLLLEEQSDQGLHRLQFPLHRLDKLLYRKATLFKLQGDYSKFFWCPNFFLRYPDLCLRNSSSFVNWANPFVI